MILFVGLTGKIRSNRIVIIKVKRRLKMERKGIRVRKRKIKVGKD